MTLTLGEMMEKMFRSFLGFLLVLMLGACQTTQKVPPEVAPVAPPTQVVEPPPEPVKPLDPTAQKEQALAAALEIYADGRYDDAISALTTLVGAPELPLSSLVKVQKFLAFSHCASGRARQCRQHFDTALDLDPTFQLTEAERGHPVWGREFNNARNAARNKRPSRK